MEEEDRPHSIYPSPVYSVASFGLIGDPSYNTRALSLEDDDDRLLRLCFMARRGRCNKDAIP